MDRSQALVVIIDDDPSIRKSLARLLHASGLQACAFESASAYLSQFDPELPGCLILDLAMPGLSGLELQEMLVQLDSAPPIIFLTGEATVPDSVRALKRGASEFLTKPVDEQALLSAVLAAIDADHNHRRHRSEIANIERRLATLTPRELQVLTHVVSGKLNKQIAGELGTVEKTIKVHRARVMEKMRAGSLAELVTLAAKARIGDGSA